VYVFEKEIFDSCAGCFLAAFRERSKRSKTHIIYIMADDLGWSEMGSYGNRFNQTPVLDSLARNGIRFTQAYTPAPVCSPTRVALMTGQHPAKVGITNFLAAKDEKFLSPDYLTLNEQLQKAGPLGRD
jgi:arylsulfatase A